MAVQLKDHERHGCCFKYGNVTKNKSRKGDGFYYTFKSEEDELINVNAYGLKAIWDVWPGRGATIKLTKNSFQEWQVELLEAADNVYPLEMKQWNEATTSFDDVPFRIPGIEAGDTPPPSTPPAEVGDDNPTPAPPAKGEWDREDLARLMEWAWGEAVRIITKKIEMVAETLLPEGRPLPDLKLPGDSVGAIERMAVTLYIDAQKKGLRLPNPAEEALQAAGVEMLSTAGVTQEPQVGMDPGEEVPTPTSPPPNYQDDPNAPLPF